MSDQPKIEPCRAIVNGKRCGTAACGDDWEGYDCPECGSDPAQGLVSWNTLQLDRRDAAILRWMRDDPRTTLMLSPGLNINEVIEAISKKIDQAIGEG
jgi:hypothetical protein